MKKSKHSNTFWVVLVLTIVCALLAGTFLALSFVPLRHCGGGATCTSDGIEEHFRNVFGVCFEDEKGTKAIDHNTIKKALGHQMVSVKAKEPTKTQDGNIAYYHCDRCGNNFEDGDGRKQLSNVVILAYNTRGLEYELIDNRLCSVRIIDNAPSEIKIDAKYQQNNIEYTVTTIKEGSGNRNKVTTIELPNTIEEIEANAFAGFSNLEEITFGDESKLFSIGNSAFENCKKLKRITIPDSVVSVGERVFYGCEGLTNVTIGGRMTSIGARLFENCKMLTSIVIPDNVVSVGERVFYGCEGLTDVTIGDGVTSIGDGAFENVGKITTATLPAFAIDYITKANLQTVVITSGESIVGRAFSGCSSLKEITIPSSVTSIDYGAFKDCEKLTIYCEVTGKPAGWSDGWNPDGRPVVWGYKSNRA